MKYKVNYKDLNFNMSRITPDAIKAETDRLTDHQTKTNENKGLFTVKPASKWIAS